MTLVDQPTAEPTRKVGRGIVAGATTALVGVPAVVAWGWEYIDPDKAMPAVVAVALGGVVTWITQSAVGYFSREKG